MFIEKLDIDYNTFYDKKEFKDVKNLIISSVNSSILLVNGEVFTAKYSGECPSGNRPIIHDSVNKGVLELKVDLDGHVDNSELIVTIPKNVNIISISTMVGCVFADILNANCLKIITTLGNVEGNYNVKKIDVNTVSGNIKLSSGAEWLKINTDSGSVELTLNEYLKDLKAESVSGDIKICSPNKNVHLIFESLGGKLISKLKDNHNSNVVFDISTIIGNVFIS